MPYLVINLDDQEDCQRGARHLRRRLRRMQSNCESGRPGEIRGPDAERQRGRGPRFDGPPGGRGPGRRGPNPRGGDPVDPKMTLKQKLERISHRGVWRFLVQIAALSDQARSLAELDAALDLPRNKMRSTKAIFAKLEKRLDLQLLVVDEDAGQDDAGNPRYAMPKRIRKQILKIM